MGYLFSWRFAYSSFDGLVDGFLVGSRVMFSAFLRDVMVSAQVRLSAKASVELRDKKIICCSMISDTLAM